MAPLTGKCSICTTMVQANGIARGDEKTVSGFMVAACTPAFRQKTAACASGSSRHSTDEFYWLRESVKIVLLQQPYFPLFLI